MTVDILIPNWNGGNRIETVLRTVRAQSYPVSSIIVADDGSQDDSPKQAEAMGARVLRSQVNRGFAATVNRGIAASAAEVIAIVNNDVELAEGWLEALVRACEAEGVWFATGKILSASDRRLIDGSYDLMCRGASAWRCGNGSPDQDLFDRPREVLLPSFTAVLVRSELFRRIGVLDERFESYLEDVDFGLRSASQGYTGRYVPGAICYHSGSATLGRYHAQTVRKIARNQVFLVAKHYPDGWVCDYGWPVAVAQLLWGMVAARHGRLVAYCRGKWDGLRRFKEMRAGRTPGQGIREILERCEREMREIQKITGSTPYWRLYFRLTAR